MKFHENPTSGSSCSVHMDRQTDMAKLTVAFLNFVNVPKK